MIPNDNGRTSPVDPGWRFCVAPMIAWTDRHCRRFHRVLSRRARLYTEMVTTGALIHGPRERLLAFDETEHPVALQLGGSEPADLAVAAQMGERAGFDEINLNCGCPSDRVQRGAFGACLMAEPQRVADGVRAMRDAVSIDVTVKHRIGLDRIESYEFVRDFVGTVSEGGCSLFIVHARNAWLQGLSPKENRDIPPLRYEIVARLARDFPDLRFVLNGGLTTHDMAITQAGLDVAGYSGSGHQDQDAPLAGVMFGRRAYEDPWMLTDVDPLYFGEPAPVRTRLEALEAMRGYIDEQLAQGVHIRALVQPMLGLFNGLAGARYWRRTLSDNRALDALGAAVVDAALVQMADAAARTTSAAVVAHES